MSVLAAAATAPRPLSLLWEGQGLRPGGSASQSDGPAGAAFAPPSSTSSTNTPATHTVFVALARAAIVVSAPVLPGGERTVLHSSISRPWHPSSRPRICAAAPRAVCSTSTLTPSPKYSHSFPINPMQPATTALGPIRNLTRRLSAATSAYQAIHNTNSAVPIDDANSLIVALLTTTQPPCSFP